MYASTLVLSLLSASAALALPHSAPLAQRSSSALSRIDLPSSALSAPPSNMTLKYALLGLGTQNYTCKTTPNDANAAPASNGALATLYDVSDVLSRGTEPTRDNLEIVLPSLALSLSDAYRTSPDKWPAPMRFQPAGHHFFTTALVPTFVLDGAKPKAQIQCKKLGDVPAPATAFAGPHAEGAVDWLQLADNGNGFSAGTPLEGGMVYRIETAGGMGPKTCAGESGDITVKYSAEYFFYGPSS